MPPPPDRATQLAQQLDWNLLKVFLAIAEAQGISRAAARLGRKQPAVSLALKRLEERLGVRLCERGPHGFSLTGEGRRLAEMCAEWAALVRQMPDRLADAAATVSGPLRIRLISNLVNTLLDDTIATFHQKYPAAELLVDVAPWADVVDALLRQEIDIGVAPSRRKRAELSYLPLFREVHRPYCGRGHSLYGRAISDPRRIAGEAFVLTGSDEPDELTDFRSAHGLGRQVAGVSEHLEEARRMAILGVGLCFLPEGYAEPDVAAGRLWPLLGKRRLPGMEIYVITNPKAPQHLSTRLFVEELRRMLDADTRPLRGRPRQH
jgi:DNA-binding transcriptional LysR family regulator